MSAALAERLRRSREFKVKVGKLTFTARRPTDVEALRLHRSESDYFDISKEFVIGWDGITENDIVGGGGSDVIPFDQELWHEWCADRPKFWKPIALAVLDSYATHSKRIQDAEKNSEPG